MTSRAKLYQTKLDGFYPVKPKGRAASTSATPTTAALLPQEGLAWFPIDVDSGTEGTPIDVEFWTHVRDHGTVPPNHPSATQQAWQLTAAYPATSRKTPTSSTGDKPATRRWFHSSRAKNVISSRKFVSVYCQKRNRDVVTGTVPPILWYRWMNNNRTSRPVCRAHLEAPPMHDAAFETELRGAEKLALYSASVLYAMSSSGYYGLMSKSQEPEIKIYYWHRLKLNVID
ncbi:hypothetical protein GGX14DRAFT_395699 [Mycena pura]|uniref:Uncharacterized protein n=1 Tax=Mycena pura TaxID=153505 RepID=A0AAD6VBV2_9AGAR|nr:hypothetical protein GGX14DRAFT_395699 [Mycena pura]